MSIDIGPDELESTSLDDLDDALAVAGGWTHGPARHPYHAAAPVYWTAGWRGILPLPPRKKALPPAGYTGRAGEDPTYPDVMAWTEDRRNGNLALRLPEGVVGLDVDNYSGKNGREELADLEAKLGPLPATWTSTSRHDHVSGIRLYRAPAELLTWHDPGKSIEIIHHGWRYVVAAPSIHQHTGNTYRWIGPGGQDATRVPLVGELPELPEAWAAEFGSINPPAEKAPIGDDAATDWVAALPARGRDCRIISSTAGRYLKDIQTKVGGRHDAMLYGSRAIAMAGAEGHSGARRALSALRDAFLTATADDPGRNAHAEWLRAMSGAVRLAAKVHPTPEETCDCPTRTWQDAGEQRQAIAELTGGTPPDDDVPGQADGDEDEPSTSYRTHDDIGNAERLRDLHGHRFRYVTDEQAWRTWDGKRWDLDTHNLIQEAAKHVAEYMGDTEVQELIAAGGGEPAAPDGFPKALVGHLNQWLADDAPAAMRWLAEDPARLEWAGRWISWANEANNAASLKKFAKKCRDMPRINAMIKAASSIPVIATDRRSFDRPGTGLLNLANGTLDTNSVTMRPHNRGDMLTKVAPVKYNPSAQAPLWHRFLLDNIPDREGDNGAGVELRRYLQKLAGYALTGRANEKLMAYLYGPSDTGKSLFVAVLLAMFGSDYAMAAAKGVLAPRGHGDDGRDPDRHDMAGARLITTSESRPGEPMDEALVKALTGRDAQRTRGNYARTNESWTPEMLLMVCSNQLPRITGDDDAIWGRIKVVPFDIQFLPGDPRRDDNLQQKIVDNEMEGVLAWAVEGLRMYRQEGLPDPALVRIATERFRSDSDGVARFIGDGADDGKLLVGENEWTERTGLYAAYSRWAGEAGVKYPLARDRFYTRIEHLGYTPRKREGKRGFAGLSLVPSTSWVGGFRDQW